MDNLHINPERTSELLEELSPEHQMKLECEAIAEAQHEQYEFLFKEPPRASHLLGWNRIAHMSKIQHPWRSKEYFESLKLPYGRRAYYRDPVHTHWNDITQYDEIFNVATDNVTSRWPGSVLLAISISG